jgi:hypothetical protein
MVFREAKRQGVQHMIATHAFDLAGKMTVEQMQEAAKLGAFIEFDFRNTLEGGRIDAIRKVGPEFCFLSEFWTKVTAPKEYGGLDGVGAFAETMRGHGFTDRELDLFVQGQPGEGARAGGINDIVKSLIVTFRFVEWTEYPNLTHARAVANELARELVAECRPRRERRCVITGDEGKELSQKLLSGSLNDDALSPHRIQCGLMFNRSGACGPKSVPIAYSSSRDL